jgi:hypothetical protein
MGESFILSKYAAFGKLSSGGEIFLPLDTRRKFVDDCTRSGIAIIGLELFHIQSEKIIPVNPISGVDNSPLLRQHRTWAQVVQHCNETAMFVLEEEAKRDDTQYYCPTIIEEHEWK